MSAEKFSEAVVRHDEGRLVLTWSQHGLTKTALVSEDVIEQLVEDLNFAHDSIADLRRERDQMSMRAHDAECALAGHKTPICGACVAGAIIGELDEPEDTGQPVCGPGRTRWWSW